VPAANVVFDMSRSDRDETAMLPDLSSKPADLAGCTPVCETFTGEGCRCTVMCGGHKYQVDCFGTTSITCSCLTDDVIMGSAVIASCNGTNEKNALLQQCVPPPS
jgi:hypothetical protein